MRMIFCLFLLFPTFCLACLPNEVFVREQWINAYTRSDGTEVSAHTRSAHCREIGERYEFKDSTDRVINKEI